MKIHRSCTAQLAFIASFLCSSLVLSSGDSGSGSEDDPWNFYGGDDNFFSFAQYGDSDMHWSNYALNPEACMARDGSDVIVFSMYSSGNNECKKKSLGMYFVTVPQYIKALSKKSEKAAELQDYDYDDPAALNYLQCTATASDDDGNVIYTRVGCKMNSWKALSVNAYSDQYCTEQIESMTIQVDLSETQVDYDGCISCAEWTIPTDDAVGYDDQIYNASEYFSPLCSAVWNYKDACDGACIKQMKMATGQRSSGSYSAPQKFMLFFLSTVGIISMGGVSLVRKKMSTEDALLEEAQVERVGIKKDSMLRVFLGIIFFLFFLMLFKVKGFLFFLLITIDTFLIGYWARLEFRQKGRIQLGGFHLYGSEDETSMS